MHLLHVAYVATLLIWGCQASPKGQEETVQHGHSPHDDEHPHHGHGHHHPHEHHESVLGSKETAEEFDKLPASESKIRLRKLAKKWDVNRDGSLDRAEMTGWIEAGRQRMDGQDADERFSSIDKNGDGHVTWEEYENDTFGGEDVSKFDADDKRLWTEDKTFFKAADVDGNGFLDKKEFLAFQTPEHYPHMFDSLIENTLNEKDTNKDGYIDLKEFLGDYADRTDSDWYESEKARFSSDYDADKDGKLDRREMRTWLAPDLHLAAQQEADRLMEQADVDKDALLSLDEIVDQHAVFVGSEATNYGDDLLKHTEL